MYYKMTNTSCEKYKQLRAFREEEIKIEKENRKAIEKIVRHPFDKFVGHSGQSSFERVTRWRGFVFTDTTNINERIWKTNKEFPDAYFPNRRYKEGKAMYSSPLTRTSLRLPKKNLIQLLTTVLNKLNS